MSMENLFRGKRLDNGEWAYGNLLESAVNETKSFIQDGVEGCPVAVDPRTVGQYTGLDDTFGNRVFKGDILKLTQDWANGSSDTWYAIVEFGNPNGLYSWGWQLRRIAGVQFVNPDILLWLGEELEESGVTSQVLSVEQALEELREDQG